MTLTKTERAALVAIANTPTDAGTVGAAVWPDRTGPISASQGGGDYAAQMLLGRLRKKGLADTVNDEGSSRWALTPAGEKALSFIHDKDGPCETCPTRFCSNFDLCVKKAYR